jgi:hypothetical protein
VFNWVNVVLDIMIAAPAEMEINLQEIGISCIAKYTPPMKQEANDSPFKRVGRASFVDPKFVDI